jgi:hypothetical protein
MVKCGDGNNNVKGVFTKREGAHIGDGPLKVIVGILGRLDDQGRDINAYDIFRRCHQKGMHAIADRFIKEIGLEHAASLPFMEPSAQQRNIYRVAVGSPQKMDTILFECLIGGIPVFKIVSHITF